MSIGKNLMVLLSILAFGFLCFVAGNCHGTNPNGNWAMVLMPSIILLPNIFEIVNGIGVYDDTWKPSEDKKKKEKK